MTVFLAEEPGPTDSSLQVRHFLLSMRETEPMLPEFSAHLADQIIGYCLPRKRLLKVISKHATNPNDLSSAMAALRREARKAFQEYRVAHPARSGEGGELLAYAFTEHFLRAPMAIAKMHTKTNTEMPVFGADGVHLRYLVDAGVLEVIYLESKVHKTIASGARDAAESIRDFLEGSQRGHELRLALDFGNFDHLDEEAQQALEDFLDPYAGARTADRRDRHACLLAYSEPAYKAVGDGAEMKEIRTKFGEGCEPRATSVANAYAAKNLPSDRITTFILGLPSVAEFRREFERALSNG
jgi:Cap4 SAVED domain